DVAATDLRFNEGMAIDYENDCGAVARYFTGLGVKNYWYGDGISSLLPEPLSVRSSVQSGVNARGIFNEIRKVYVWSLANPDNIASYLDMGVDGILVEANPAGSFTGAYVEATVGQVNSRSDIRLATRSDFAFSRAITSDLPPGAFGGSIVEYWGGWPANFTPPLDAAMVLPGGRGYFFKGDQYFRYDDSGHAPANAPSSFVKGDWPNWPSDFYPIDAAVFWPPTGKVYFFKGDQYIRYNLPEYGGREGVDQGPSPIQGNWPGLVEALKLDANSGLDAAIYWPDGNAYFIKGEQCATYASGVNQGEPEGVVGVPIAFGDTVRKLLNFANIGPIKIDAGLYWPNGRVTLLMGANYFIYPTNKNLI
ncbi:MAG: protein of unknown function, putative Hemopexin domain, partial [Acidobacteria bacterium]|nr:protein of unknown function, putative Hemopexin domain [Acidobacteriota bacterium]